METSFTPAVGMDWRGPGPGRRPQSGESSATICLPVGCKRFPLLQSLRFCFLDIVCGGSAYLLLAVSSFLVYLPAGGGRRLRSPPSAGDCPVRMLTTSRGYHMVWSMCRGIVPPCGASAKWSRITWRARRVSRRLVAEMIRAGVTPSKNRIWCLVPPDPLFCVKRSFLGRR